MGHFFENTFNFACILKLILSSENTIKLYLSDYFNREQNALRRASRYWNRGDARTGPQKWIGNVGGNIMGGLRNIGQGIGRFMGDRFQYKPAVASAGGYSAAQLNQLNARGGYYSEPARDERFLRSRRNYRSQGERGRTAIDS